MGPSHLPYFCTGYKDDFELKELRAKLGNEDQKITKKKAKKSMEHSNRIVKVKSGVKVRSGNM